jgi:hypothetical protein
MRKAILGFLAAAILFGQANAMQIVHKSLDAVLSEADAALVVEVDAVSEQVKEGFWVHVDFDARPLKTLFGSVESADTLLLTYYQGMPHYRGNTPVSPLVSGSGLEFNLKKGDHVIVLLKANDLRAGRLSVLRVEPLTQLKAIQRVRQ